MQTTSDIGIITMAFGGERYFNQANTLARSLRRHMPGYQLALLTDKPEKAGLFDIAVPIADYKVAGTLLKIEMYERSPFEQTFFIDSDCIAVRSFEDHLERIAKYDFSPVVSEYLEAGDSDLWLKDVGAALEKVGGTRFPKFNGGVYFFRKSETADEVFKRSHTMLERVDELGILSFDAAGPGEETLIGLALAEMDYLDLYDDGGGLMRTPLNSSGPIELDALEGTCAFTKHGKRVSPAICHFCGPFINHPAYHIARRELRDGKRAPWTFRAGQQAIHQTNRIKKKLTASG